MIIKSHPSKNENITEIISDEIVISDVSSGTDLMGDVYYNGFEKVIIHAKNITPEFFDLKTKLAGEILQKFSNYRIRLAIVGDFENVKSNSLRDFIRESNRTGHVNFAASVESAILMLSK